MGFWLRLLGHKEKKDNPQVKYLNALLVKEQDNTKLLLKEITEFKHNKLILENEHKAIINVKDNEINELKNNVLTLKGKNYELELQIKYKRYNNNTVQDVNINENTSNVQKENKIVDVNNIVKLSPKLKELYDLTLQVSSFEELLKVGGYKENTLRVNLSRIRRKGWEVKL